MDDSEVFLLIMMLVLTACTSLLLGWMSYKIYKIKKDIPKLLDDIYTRKENAAAAIELLENLIQKLNSTCRDHERRINDIEELLLSEKSEEPEYTCKDCKYYSPYSGIGFASAVNYFKCEKIGCSYPIVCDKVCRAFEKKESSHPDSEIDYSTVDEDGNITEVWFEGKRYIPEDKRDEDTITLYADGRVVAETESIEKLNYMLHTGPMSVAEYSRRLAEWIQNDT